MHIKRMLAALLCLMMLVGCALAESTGQQPADFSEKFADKFLAEGENTIIGQELYQSQNLYIQITSFRQDNSDVYVADIYLRSMDCLQRGFAGGKWKKTQAKVRVIAQDNYAVMAMTGDNSQNFTAGWVVANGNILRKTKNSESSVLSRTLLKTRKLPVSTE